MNRNPHLHGVLEEKARTFLALGFFYDFVETFSRLEHRPLTRDEFLHFWEEAMRCAEIQKPHRDG